MLLDNVHKMVNGGLALQPYVHPDCGAHYGVPFLQETPEMFVRWAQFCAMGTIVRFHTNNCCDHRPWSWGEEAESAIRKVLKLRYSLMPTLIAAGRRASEDGTPVVQRLDLTWPELAEQGANRDDQYLFADGAMLIAPIIPFNGSDPVAKNPTNGSGNASRLVWVPPGEWVSGWSSASVVTGPTTVEVKDCPLDQIPMWHKKGSLVLTTEPGRAASEQTWQELSIEVFPFSLRETIITDESTRPRRWESTLYDTKAVGADESPGAIEGATAAGAAVPRTALVLEQHPTGGQTTLTVTNGPSARSRRWRLRLHLLPGEVVGSVSVTTSQHQDKDKASRKTTSPQLLELVTLPDGRAAGGAEQSESGTKTTSHALVMASGGGLGEGDVSTVVGTVVEAVFADDNATPREEYTFSFEVHQG